MDLGASWIHGVEGNPLTELADEAGAPRLRTSYQSSTAYDSTGRVIDLGPASDRAERVIARARRAAEARDRDVSLAQAIQSTGHWSEADGDERRAIRHVVNSTVEQEYGGDWSEVSAWHYDDSKEFAGGDELFPQGFDAIVTHLAAGLDIRLGQVVSNIERTGAGVRISTAGGATIDGRRAIVTLPAGVLKSGAIKFAAPLDPRRQRAIEAIGMGLLNKCWLRFDRISWPADVDWLEWLGPQDGYWSQWVSLAHRAKVPVLLAFHAGEQARHMERHDDRTMADMAHAALKSMFGTSIPAPAAIQISRWSADPFARGAYSFNAVGVTRATRQALFGLDWDGWLFFAGEAASADYFGTAHGAVLSGRAAARAILSQSSAGRDSR